MTEGVVVQRRKRRARKTTEAVDPRMVVFSCDMHPRMRVVIPEWMENDRLKAWPYAEFTGGRLDMGRHMTRLHLTDEEAMQAITVLLNTQHVYAEKGLKEKPKCGFCGKVFPTPKQLRTHSIIAHGERLNMVEARHGRV